MKRILLSLSLLVSIAYITSCTSEVKEVETPETKPVKEVNQETSEAEKVFAIKSGIIKYRQEEEVENAVNITVRFEDYGNKLLSQVETGKAFGDENFNVIICNLKVGDIYYNYQTSDNEEAYKTYNIDKVATKQKVIGDFELVSFSKYSAEELAEQGVTKLDEKATILDKECDIYLRKTEGSELKVYLWNNLWLKTEGIEGANKMTVTAVEIIENPEIEANVFEVPKGFKIEDITITPDEETIVE